MLNGIFEALQQGGADPGDGHDMGAGGMKTKLTISSEEIRRRAITILQSLPLDVIHSVEVKEYKTTRNLEQNARMWAMLADISKQVDWYGQHLSKEEWKCVFSATLKQQKVVPGLDTGFVVMAQSTSKMTVAEMAEMIELITAFGVTHDVKFSARDLEEYP